MEGKEVFISHSSKDHVFAEKMCSILEKNGIYCWIAPRDIPYGNVWSAEICDAIQAAKLLIFIFSENSNNSRQVIREICLAEQYGKNVIAAKISDIQYNPALNYYLSIYHWVNITKDMPDTQIETFAKELKTILSADESELSSASVITHTDIPMLDDDYNVDNELDAKFKTLSSADENGIISDCAEASPFKKKLLDRIKQRFTKEIFVASNVSDGLHQDTAEEPFSDDQEHYFTASEKQGQTIAFLIRKRINESDFSVSFYTEELLKEESEDEESAVDYTLYAVDYEGNPIVTITFLNEQSIALVNMGFVYKNTIKFSTNPSVMEMTTLSPKKYDEDDIMLYPANKDGSAIIIDPISCKVLKRKKLLNKENNKWGYYIELIPGKKYFVFNINSNNSNTVTANPFTAGYGYYKGKYGLKKNILSAAEWFDKAATKDAYYFLTEIFTSDPLLADENDAAYYKSLYDNCTEE